jgi:hypothetical protein
MMFAAALALTACSERNLPNGYKYVMLNTYQAVIADSAGHIVVDTDVRLRRISGHKVFGDREPEKLWGKPPHRLEEPQGEYGQFVLDTSTGAVSFAAGSRPLP